MVISVEQATTILPLITNTERMTMRYAYWARFGSNNDDEIMLQWYVNNQLKAIESTRYIAGLLSTAGAITEEQTLAYLEEQGIDSNGGQGSKETDHE